MSLLPPSLAVEQEPLSEAQLDEFADGVVDAAAETVLTVVEVVDELLTNLDVVEDESAETQRWQITGTDTAEWAMRKLAEVEHKRRAAIEQAQEWRDRIDAWLLHELNPLEARAAFFEHHLERYALAQRETDPKAKTLTLPSGTVRTRESGPRVVVTDEAAAVKWAKTSLPLEKVAEVVKVTERVMVGTLKTVVQTVKCEDGGWIAIYSGGEVVPGVEVEPPSVSAKAVPDVE